MAFPTDQTVSFTGQNNLAGDKRALFQQLYAGEVLTQFKQKNLMMGKHRVKTIKSGKSYSFPLVGTTGTKYHTAGQLIEGDAIEHGERLVSIDELLISPVFIDRVDEAMNHFDVRSIYTAECGMALANQADRNILRTAAKAADVVDAATAATAGLGVLTTEKYVGGVTLGAVGDELKGEKIVEAIFQAKQLWAEADIPDDDAFVVLKPAQYYALFNMSSGVDKLVYMNKDVGGVGSVAEGTIPTIAGLPVFMTNHLPSGDQSVTLSDNDPASAVRPGEYKANYSKLVALVMKPDAVATVKLFDLATESEYQINRQGWLFVAKYAMGHNILRHQYAISIKAA